MKIGTFWELKTAVKNQVDQLLHYLRRHSLFLCACMSQHDASFLNENKTAEVYNDDSIWFTHTRNKQCLNQSLYHFRIRTNVC